MTCAICKNYHGCIFSIVYTLHYQDYRVIEKNNASIIGCTMYYVKIFRGYATEQEIKRILS